MHTAVATSPSDTKHVLNPDLKGAQARYIQLRGFYKTQALGGRQVFLSPRTLT